MANNHTVFVFIHILGRNELQVALISQESFCLDLVLNI